MLSLNVLAIVNLYLCLQMEMASKGNVTTSELKYIIRSGYKIRNYNEFSSLAL